MIKYILLLSVCVCKYLKICESITSFYFTKIMLLISHYFREKVSARRFCRIKDIRIQEKWERNTKYGDCWSALKNMVLKNQRVNEIKEEYLKIPIEKWKQKYNILKFMEEGYFPGSSVVRIWCFPYNLALVPGWELITCKLCGQKIKKAQVV